VPPAGSVIWIVVGVLLIIALVIYIAHNSGVI
jgi:hypothetical protein